MAGKILASKMKAIEATGADQVVTANPGCSIQLEQGLRRKGIAAKVPPVVDLLDEAYQAEVGVA